jgi:hypothetical protein
MTTTREPTAIACSLDRDDLAERRMRWSALRARAASETTRTARGVRLSFRAEPGVAEELEALVALERDCCAFVDWAVDADNEQVVLEVSADGELAIAAAQNLFRGF